MCDEHTMGLRSSGSGTLSAKESRTRGVGVRVVRERSVGFAYGSLPGGRDAVGLVERALASCSFNEPLETSGPILPVPEAKAPLDTRSWVEGVQAWSMDEAWHSLDRFAQAAQSTPGGHDVPRCHYGVSLRVVAIAGSSGIRTGYHSGVHFLWGRSGTGTSPRQGLVGPAIPPTWSPCAQHATRPKRCPGPHGLPSPGEGCPSS
ncbi:PmbA/TldA family metallopeptidase [Nocardiopsis salina]|uniref:PmbA/TldA family metallopeptidase n=1 Tax=Nocardiopsis salina TaxID=245836 RepID=UPI00373AF506